MVEPNDPVPPVIAITAPDILLLDNCESSLQLIGSGLILAFEANVAQKTLG
jgi:hypothetical protein